MSKDDNYGDNRNISNYNNQDEKVLMMIIIVTTITMGIKYYDKKNYNTMIKMIAIITVITVNKSINRMQYPL